MAEDLAQLTAALPPGLSYAQAARLMGRKYTTVRSLLIRAGYQSPDGRESRFILNPARGSARWARVNWTLSNIVISRKLGVSREMVRRMRNKLGKPFVESRGAKPKKRHASSNAKAAKVHGDVQPQPREGNGQVPSQESR